MVQMKLVSDFYSSATTKSNNQITTCTFLAGCTGFNLKCYHLIYYNERYMNVTISILICLVQQ